MVCMFEITGFKMHLSGRFGIFFLLLLWRLMSVIIVQTAHVPDEYWQSLEVAHHLAFNYGYLTWEWTIMIRSYIYPFFISILYCTLAFLSLDFTLLLTMLPRVFQATFAAYGDYRFYKWTKCKWMLLVLCSNWYWYYCASRTLINSVETVCTTIALSIFPWQDNRVQSTKFLWIVGFLCMIRPTAAIIWFPLCLHHICSNVEKKALLGHYAMIGTSCFLISVSVDSYCYGKFVITPWKFFQINVLKSVGDSYGKEHTLWYIFVGLPVILGLYYIPFLIAVWQIFKHPAYFHRELIMFVIIGWTLFVYSFLSHKEFRFILPLLPMLIYISSACTRRLNVRITAFARKSILALLICSNIVPGFYFSLIHQRGTLNVMELLQQEIYAIPSPINVLILTPCHAMPLYSHLHVNVSVKFLTCKPNLDNSNDYLDEADQFFANPTLWLDNNYVNNKNATLPTYVIIFDNVVNEIIDFLYRYKLIAKIFYTHFPQSNYGEYVLLYKM
ncbi:GPI mannosyltransferase 3 [Nylanderia fulva]|uniref:GPI mannosyltransferase 3 n=1 Tax=Nylanderia fulva TaxID=613905 RepID=UPI0010FB6964|nr:GPI mannosyltransferase 3 [Nylanderia fulva]XP_029164118.1 GPI mannosyltransferase 3 [Nylanderia fulva]